MKTNSLGIPRHASSGLVLALLAGLLVAETAHAQFPGGFGRGNGNGGTRNGATGPSVQQTAQQVTVVADEYSNSLIILAPDVYQGAISNLVKQLDVAIQDITELRVFALENADPTEMAAVINELFQDQNSATSSNNRGSTRGGGFRFGGTATTESERSKLQTKVVAVADPRTSSVLVTASKALMEQISPMIEQLDASSSKKQKVFVYSLENADSSDVETVLKNLFETTNSRNGRTTSQNNQQNNALQQRQNNNSRTQGSNNTTSRTGNNTGTGTGTGR